LEMAAVVTALLVLGWRALVANSPQGVHAPS